MKSTFDKYAYRVIFEADEDGYHAYVPALPGCHTWGKNLTEAKQNIREAIKSHVGSLIKDKEKVPTDPGFESLETFSPSELQSLQA